MSLLSLVFVKCKPEKELASEQQELQKIQKSSEDFAAKSTEYRAFSPQISFFDPVTEKDNPQVAIQKRKEFIKQSGLPDEISIGEF